MGPPLCFPGEADGPLRNFHRRYIEQWINRATRAEIDSLVAARPVVPRHLDASLLAHVESKINRSLRGQEPLRHAARGAFWDRITAGSIG